MFAVNRSAFLSRLGVYPEDYELSTHPNTVATGIRHYCALSADTGAVVPVDHAVQRAKTLLWVGPETLGPTSVWYCAETLPTPAGDPVCTCIWVHPSLDSTEPTRTEPPTVHPIGFELHVSEVPFGSVVTGKAERFHLYETCARPDSYAYDGTDPLPFWWIERACRSLLVVGDPTNPDSLWACSRRLPRGSDPALCVYVRALCDDK